MSSHSTHHRAARRHPIYSRFHRRADFSRAFPPGGEFDLKPALKLDWQFARRLGIFAMLLVAPAVPAAGQSVVSVETSPQMFAVLCAIQTAGYEADINPATLNPVRAKLRPELLAKKGPAVEQLRAFYRGHELSGGDATLSRYVSFALVVGPPPTFEFTVPHDQLPPDVLALEGFTEVLSAYYREAEIDRIWARAQPEYARQVRLLEGGVADSVFVSAGYLREILKPNPQHMMTVYVEPMVGARTNFRNYGGRYALVLDPVREISLDEVRHSFLHFMIDYLPLRYRAPMAGRKALLDIAARAPRLSPEIGEDFTALLTECLIKAVELKVRHLTADKTRAALDQAEAVGFILERAVYTALDGYEKAELSMREYYPKLLAILNFNAEAKRLATVQFAAVSADAPNVSPHPAPPRPEPSELERWLAEGRQQLDAQDPAAVATYERILAKYPDVPRAQYGLGVASVIRGDVERAKALLQKVVQALSQAGGGPDADPQTLAWSHVWLARIYDVEERRDLAVPEYRAALGVEGAPQSARSAAQRGLEKP
jgi:tetratricopeptide (TPR) repeat protein